MASALEKVITLYGLLGDLESSYGGGATLTAADDAILLADKIDVPIMAAVTGERGPAPGVGASFARVQPRGWYTEFPLIVIARGAGSAYSTSVVPRDLHAALQMSGHSAVLDDTGGSEQYTYAPVSALDDFESAAFEGYSRDEMIELVGAYSDFIFDIDGASFMRCEFPLRAVVDALPVDTALPSMTYQDLTVIPPTAVNLSIALGNFTGARSRKIRFQANRNVFGPRIDQNAASNPLAGFGIGRRNPTIEWTIEQTALATSPYHAAAAIDPYRLRDAGTELAFSFTLGSAQYNRIVFTASQVQVVDVRSEEDDEAALWTLALECHTSDAVTDDDYQIELT
jgi:hypothetical protein